MIVEMIAMVVLQPLLWWTFTMVVPCFSKPESTLIHTTTFDSC